MPGRLYSEAEVGAIIRRAVELQEQGQAQSYTPGVTELELERIANEMGISVDCLRKALVEHGGRGAERALGKLVFSKDVECVVDGELDPDDFDFIANELPTSGSNQMLPTQIGRTLKATVMAGGSMAHVNVTARNGRTKIKVNTKPILTTVFGGQAALFGTMFGTALLANQHSVPGLAVMLAGLAGGVALFWGGMKAGNRKASELANSIATAVEERIKETLHKPGLEERLAKAPDMVDESPETKTQQRLDT